MVMKIDFQYAEQEMEAVESIYSKVKELLQRKIKLNDIRYDLYLAGNSVKQNFNEAKFNKIYIEPIDLEIKKLLKLVVND